MPTRVEDYEVLHTIGTGSYGRCQKIRRKSDGKVSAGSCLSPPLLGFRQPLASALCPRSKRPGTVGLQGWVPGRVRSVSGMLRDGRLRLFIYSVSPFLFHFPSLFPAKALALGTGSCLLSYFLQKSRTLGQEKGGHSQSSFKTSVIRVLDPYFPCVTG